MSSASLGEGHGSTLAAWETDGRVYFTSVDPKTRKVSQLISPVGGQGRKHPVVVGNERGQTLLAWTEGTNWGKGGSVVWQVYDRDGTVNSDHGRAEGLPAWSLPTAFATAQGDFVILY
jgi:hypothetical protein